MSDKINKRNTSAGFVANRGMRENIEQFQLEYAYRTLSNAINVLIGVALELHQTDKKLFSELRIKSKIL